MQKKNTYRILLIFEIVTTVLLVLFTFTQIDLSLTLSQQTVFQDIQKAFQFVGFYQRPIATGWYLGLLALLFIAYIACLLAAKKKIFTEKSAWIYICIVCFIVFFSYPASFSYDIFNYVFTAKTILLYGKNPYIVKPLDFQGIDSMLSFMRWTHLPSAYTPLWISFTIIPYLISFGSLILVIWAMKLVPVFFYLLSIWSIRNILNKIHPEKTIFGMLAFALNPLVILEVLVGAHNDIVMMAFALLAYQYYLNKKTVASFFLFSLSVASKFITIFLFPLYIWKWSVKKALFLLTGALFLVLFRREFLPWYFLWIIPFVVLLPDQSDILAITIGISLGLVLRYAPVFYFGDYNPPVPMIQNIVFFFPIVLSIVFAMLQSRKTVK